MAGVRNQNRDQNRRAQRYTAAYVDGNAARKIEERKETPRKKLSREAQKNRAKSTSLGSGYIFFLAVMCSLATAACVHYLQLNAEVTAQRSAVTSKKLELNDLKSYNDAYYSKVTASVDLEEIKRRAINELGMQFVTEDQIRYYTPGNNSYVRQYQDVPES